MPPALFGIPFFQNEKGGCLTVEAIGSYTNFRNSTSNGIQSVPFNSEFPFAFRFLPSSQKDCRDLRDDILIYNTIMSTAFGLLVRASAGVFYWVRWVSSFSLSVVCSASVGPLPDTSAVVCSFPICSVCFGFWHVTLASDPRSFPRERCRKRWRTIVPDPRDRINLTCTTFVFYSRSSRSFRIFPTYPIFLLRFLPLRVSMGLTCIQQSDF